MSFGGDDGFAVGSIVGLVSDLRQRIKRSYAGREADAPWRKTALERIEQQLAERLELPGTKAARGIIDRLRAKQVHIENIGSHRFKLAA